MIDVAQLLEDSETKTDALEKVAELEDELSHVCRMSFLPDCSVDPLLCGGGGGSDAIRSGDELCVLLQIKPSTV